MAIAGAREPDLGELLGPELEASTLRAVSGALRAHEGLAVVVEVEAPDASTVLHTSGVLRGSERSALDFYVGGERLPSGNVVGFRAVLRLPEDACRIARCMGGYRLGLAEPGDCALAIALLEDES